MIISSDTGKPFGKIQHAFIIKTLKKLGIVGKVLILRNDIFFKPTDNIVLTAKRVDSFVLRSETIKNVHSYSFYSTSYLRV